MTVPSGQARVLDASHLHAKKCYRLYGGELPFIQDMADTRRRIKEEAGPAAEDKSDSLERDFITIFKENGKKYLKYRGYYYARDISKDEDDVKNMLSVMCASVPDALRTS